MRRGFTLLLTTALGLGIHVGANASAPEPGPAPTPAGTPTDPAAHLLVVVGAAGDPEYAMEFEAQVRRWKTLADAGGARMDVVGLEASDPETDRDRLAALLAGVPKEGPADLWVVLVGHGTFDGREARFNLRGPDLSPADLSGWLAPIRRRTVVVAGFSASAPFLPGLAATNRIVLSATRTGNEQNYTRFGGQLAGALSDPAADRDQDGQVSVLEAFLRAAHGTAEFYRTAGRLMTEHALLDDDGDGRGTPADWFRGLRVERQARDGAVPDGMRAHQVHLVPSAAEQALPASVRAARDAVEREVEVLRVRKASLPEEEYYRQLEVLMLRLAAVYQPADARPSP